MKRVQLKDVYPFAEKTWGRPGRVEIMEYLMRPTGERPVRIVTVARVTGNPDLSPAVVEWDNYDCQTLKITRLQRALEVLKMMVEEEKRRKKLGRI